MNVFDILLERGFFKQTNNEAALRTNLGKPGLTYYIGFDPSADSLHVGSLVPIMAMAHLQKAGHRPIAIIGGGTGLIGDPSGKTEMRKMLTVEEIETNGKGILAQLQRYLNLDGEAGLFINNADWLVPLNYIEFLRDIGRYFKINEMIRAESVRLRLDRAEGLSFIEFNYQLLQAYDFLVLYEKYGCVLQMGGDDQWGNILAGIELIRRVKRAETYALTFPLLTTATGGKMGKTEKGTVWLDPKRTSPYEFYQYWRNCDDRDVERFLGYFTFLPMDEVKHLGSLEDEEVSQAKEVLAFEVTKLAHGEEETKKAREASRAAFAGESSDTSAIPTSEIKRSRLRPGISVIDLFDEIKLSPTRSQTRRLIRSGGVYINKERITNESMIINETYVVKGVIMLRIGKKTYRRLSVTD